MPPVAINLVRGIAGALQDTPRGIDRIDAGYRSFLIEAWPEESFGVLPTLFGVRYFDKHLFSKGHERLAAYWREVRESDRDAAFLRLKAAMEGHPLPPAPKRPARGHKTARGAWRAANVVLASGVKLGHPVARLPKGTIYLDVGHYGLHHPWTLRWLERRPDIKPVFMLHDAIPHQHPEMVAADTLTAHKTAMQMAARYAKAIIVPTEAAGTSIRQELERLGRRDVPFLAASLPIDRIFLDGCEPYAEFARQPYFLLCGAIEQRKNLAVLIDAWRRIEAELGARTPKLVVAGSLGFRSADVLRQLAGEPQLAPHIIIASGLSTPTIARLMVGARAVLMPSFAEGFGLPPVEALALGTPAVLSDIPAHRDATNNMARYLAPEDGAAWAAEVRALTLDETYAAELRKAAKAFRPVTWPLYMDTIFTFLKEIQSRP